MSKSNSNEGKNVEKIVEEFFEETLLFSTVIIA